MISSDIISLRFCFLFVVCKSEKVYYYKAHTHAIMYRKEKKRKEKKRKEKKRKENRKSLQESKIKIGKEIEI